MHQEIIKGGDKTSLALWEGDCVSWFLWQLACMANKIFPPTWVTAGCILQTQHGVNKHVLKGTGTNSRCGQIFGGDFGEYCVSTGLHQNLMPKGWNRQWKGASQHCILTTRITGIFITRCLHHHQRYTGSAQGQEKKKKSKNLQYKWHPNCDCWEIVG